MYMTGFVVLCLIAIALAVADIVARGRVPAEELIIDDEGITRIATRVREHVAWANIARVRILTTDEGPYVEDVFFLIDAKGGGGCSVSHDLAVRGKLLKALEARLEGVNEKAVIEAMGSTSNRIFTIWESRSPG